MNIGTFQDMIEQYKRGNLDCTNNGECTQCGQCCGSLLPLSKKEISIIREYVKWKGIKPCKHLGPFAELPIDFTCPFLDTSKSKEKCLIYDIRPEICRVYKCDNAQFGTDEEREFFRAKHYIVNMWDEFFPGLGCN